MQKVYTDCQESPSEGFQNGMILRKDISFKGVGRVHGLARELLVFFPYLTGNKKMPSIILLFRSR